ncbi:hypothetical protein CIK06_18570 [Plantactinospora sp. KBS50]|nr:hypothetical protein CIK06_18570 [Plantactinospora sp. KBS50]
MRVAELRDAIERLLAAIEVRFGEEIRFTGDFYWSVGLTESFDLVSESVASVDVASLVDDVASIREIVGQAVDEPVVLWHDLTHLAGLLRGIARLDTERPG